MPPKFTWNNEQLIAAVKSSTGLMEVQRKLGLSDTGTSHGVARRLEELNLDTTHWNPRPWTDDQLREAVKTSLSMNKTLQKLGYDGHGSSIQVQRRIKELSLDTSHWRLSYSGRKLGRDQVLCKNSKATRPAVKYWALKELSYECADCKNTGTHNGKLLSLQLDHINGDDKDNRLSNLRFLCPNCHSQTKTYAGKNTTQCSKCGMRACAGNDVCERCAA